MATPVASINHLGLSVGNIEKAIAFYKEVMGWCHIGGPFQINNDGGPSGNFSNTLYGKDGHEWTSFRLAHMVTGNGVGVELLEFEGGYDSEDPFEYKKHGLFHFAITVPDVEEFVEKVKEYGGEAYCDLHVRKISDVNTTYTIYVKDPFQNIFEVHSHNYTYLNKML